MKRLQQISNYLYLVGWSIFALKHLSLKVSVTAERVDTWAMSRCRFTKNSRLFFLWWLCTSVHYICLVFERRNAALFSRAGMGSWLQWPSCPAVLHFRSRPLMPPKKYINIRSEKSWNPYTHPHKNHYKKFLFSYTPAIYHIHQHKTPTTPTKTIF